MLLPPSETKRPGGRRVPLALDRLALPGLTAQREATVGALVALAQDPELAARVLKLSPRQLDDVAANATLLTGPTLPAVDRYTGVLYDALAAGSLDAAGRRWLGRHALIHAAAFGPVGALDRIPAYRLGPATTLPGLPPLRRVWADVVTDALRASRETFVLDLRSEAYVALGPVPASVPSAYVRVVATSDDGTVRALNHVNKTAKGRFVRALAESRPAVRSLRGLLRWAGSADISLTPRRERGAVAAHQDVGAMTYAPAMSVTGGWARLARRRRVRWGLAVPGHGGSRGRRGRASRRRVAGPDRCRSRPAGRHVDGAPAAVRGAAPCSRGGAAAAAPAVPRLHYGHDLRVGRDARARYDRVRRLRHRCGDHGRMADAARSRVRGAGHRLVAGPR